MVCNLVWVTHRAGWIWKHISLIFGIMLIVMSSVKLLIPHIGSFLVLALSWKNLSWFTSVTVLWQNDIISCIWQRFKTFIKASKTFIFCSNCSFHKGRCQLKPARSLLFCLWVNPIIFPSTVCPIIGKITLELILHWVFKTWTSRKTLQMFPRSGDISQCCF